MLLPLPADWKAATGTGGCFNEWVAADSDGHTTWLLDISLNSFPALVMASSGTAMFLPLPADWNAANETDWCFNGWVAADSDGQTAWLLDIPFKSFPAFVMASSETEMLLPLPADWNAATGTDWCFAV